MNDVVLTLIMAQAERTGPRGPEFGKAAPIGLLVIVLLLLAVFALAWSANKHYRRVKERTRIAETYGVDPFDNAAIERIQAEEAHWDRPQVSRRAPQEPTPPAS